MKDRALKIKIESNFFSFLENLTFNFGSPCPRYLPEICPLHHKKAHFFDVKFVPKRTWQLSITLLLRGIPAPPFYYKTPNASYRLHKGRPTVYQNPKTKNKFIAWAVYNRKPNVNQVLKKEKENSTILVDCEDLPKSAFLNITVYQVYPYISYPYYL